jgi:hypothetical protein
MVFSASFCCRLTNLTSLLSSSVRSNLLTVKVGQKPRLRRILGFQSATRSILMVGSIVPSTMHQTPRRHLLVQLFSYSETTRFPWENCELVEVQTYPPKCVDSECIRALDTLLVLVSPAEEMFPKPSGDCSRITLRHRTRSAESTRTQKSLNPFGRGGAHISGEFLGYLSKSPKTYFAS